MKKTKTSKELERGLQRGLRALRMPGMRMAFHEIADLARQESMSFEHFLLTLVDHEQQSRTQNRIQRALQASRLLKSKTLDSFERTRLPLKLDHQLRTLLEGGFLDRKENVLALGPTGSGKTHLLCALGQELVDQGRRVIFYTSSELVHALIRAKQEQQLQIFMKQLLRYEALIIDQLGYVKHSREEMDLLFHLLAERYERASVLITTHLPFSQWETIFYDPMNATAVVDRLVHHCAVLELNLPSYRLEVAQRRQKNADEASS
ncbi:MAG: AAA family ATPase [Rhodothermaceae bacterium]|nr:AAA family ATPase [Rhodothermaceae bacterium]MYB59468.1 AAA family ATPase [Gemmatimonadota bacterium]MXW33529.1 AAA family ATPase [Rhodothermaceae bacterium]MYE64019.1 AAA family ATPase [Rhodothermaceae bacterium]MYG70648.1 AAA family ATPase [Rhodothermaceae bacterium]